MQRSLSTAERGRSFFYLLVYLNGNRGNFFYINVLTQKQIDHG